MDVETEAESTAGGAASQGNDSGSSDPPPQENGLAMDLPPNNTLYVNNLNEKVKLEELKKSLYALFSQAGQVLEVIAARSWRLRGQAWVVFKEISSATKAMNDLQGFQFHDKPMNIRYARAKSDVIAEMEGIPVDKEKRKVEKRKRQEEVDANRAKKKQATEKTNAQTAVKANKALKPRNEPPNHILFVENLPEEANEAVLTALFSQYPGFKEVNMVPGRDGIAFVVFHDEMQAEIAKSGLQHFKIHGDIMIVISFAKKSS